MIKGGPIWYAGSFILHSTLIPAGIMDVGNTPGPYLDKVTKS